MTAKNKLDNNKTDLLVSATKSVVGIIPGVGPLLSELVSNLIPNQRFERLTKYTIELDKKLSKIPSDVINSLKADADFIDLIEEGFVQASRAVSDERKQYIVSIISNGISDEKISLQESKYFMKILQDLTDIEIIWLRYYLNPQPEGYDDFRDKHDNILAAISVHMGSDDETLTKYAIQKSYKEHLERLKLIRHIINFDKKTGLPDFERRSGKPKISYSEITSLGRLLLKQIGLIDDLDY